MDWSTVSTLNEQLALLARHHRIDCVELDGENHWSVICRVCREGNPNHPNYGNDKTWPAPFGEEMATRIALDHLDRMGYVPRRLAGQGQGRNRYE
jgi:hypothetical protein